jgi:subtilisin family serine protease
VVPDQVIVRFRPGADAAEVRADEGAELERRLPLAGLQLLDIRDGQSVAAAVRALEEHPEVMYAEPDYIQHVDATVPDDSRFGELWGLHNTGQPVNGTAGLADRDIDAPEAWDLTTGSAGVTVAVVDTGVAMDHPDLAPNLWANAAEAGGAAGVDDDGNGYVDDVRGWDFVGSCSTGSWSAACGENDPSDMQGHGTHVAGTIAARGNDGNGVTGVAWRAKLMPLRVCGPQDSGCPTSAILTAFDYAGDMGAQVVNASLGGPSFSQSTKNVIDAHPDTLYVVAAGNDATNNDSTAQYPCSYTSPNIVCVAATGSSDQLASFSNYGAAAVDLAAPGVSTLSASSERVLFADDFEADDFAGKWATGADAGTSRWGRTTESRGVPAQTSPALADSPNANTIANEDTWVEHGTGVSTQGYATCTVRFQLYQALGTGQALTLIGTRNGGTRTAITAAYTGSLSGTATVRLTDFWDNRAWIKPGFRLVTGATALGDGSYVDNFRLICNGAQSDGGHRFLQGTSMATPHVAGAAALIWAREPGATAAQAKAALLAGADPVAALAGKTVSGGRLNAHRALLSADVLPPDTVLEAGGPSGVTADRTATFSFSTPEPQAALECSLDAGAFGSCTAPATYSGLGDGDHTFRVRARDMAGNADPTPAVRSWRVDGAAPQTTIDSGPAPVTASRAASVSFSSSEPGTVECRRDGGGWSGCTSPVALADLPEGSHDLEVRARDEAGNVDATPAAHKWAVDVTAPVVSFVTRLTGAQPPVPSFSFAALDAAGGTECSIDGGEWVSCQSPLSVSGLEPGSHDLAIRARDAAGNYGEARRSFVVARKPARSPGGLADLIADMLEVDGGQALLAAGGLKAAYELPRAGTLEVRLVHRRRVGRGRRARTVVVDVVSRSFSFRRAGEKRLALEPSRAGRRILRRAGERLSIRAVFTPRRGRASEGTATAILGRRSGERVAATGSARSAG